MRVSLRCHQTMSATPIAAATAADKHRTTSGAPKAQAMAKPPIPKLIP
jgi:hypothetical protein